MKGEETRAASTAKAGGSDTIDTRTHRTVSDIEAEMRQKGKKKAGQSGKSEYKHMQFDEGPKFPAIRKQMLEYEQLKTKQSRKVHLQPTSETSRKKPPSQRTMSGGATKEQLEQKRRRLAAKKEKEQKTKRQEDQQKKEANDEQFRQWKKKKAAAIRAKKQAESKEGALSDEKRLAQKEEHARQLLQLRGAQKQWNKERSDLELRIVKAEEKWASKNMKQIKLKHGQYSPPPSPEIMPNRPRSHASFNNKGGNKSKRRTKQKAIKAQTQPESETATSDSQLVTSDRKHKKKKRKQGRKNKTGAEKERALKTTYQ